MARLIKGWDIGEVWYQLLSDIYNIGRVVSPRDQGTREIQNVTIEVSEGLSNILVHSVRDLNYKFMVAEWLWIISGSDDVESIAEYNSNIRDFSDDGLIFNGAYGPRLMPQLPFIIEKLAQADTRQAVATIWTPNPKQSKDIPCTISLQWMIREDALWCTVNMRSSDVWLGLPYDFFNFSMISNLIGALINKPLAGITMNLGSSHLYHRNINQATQVLNSKEVDTEKSPEINALIDYEVIKHILQKPELHISEAPYPWNKYAKVLAGKRSEALGVLRGIAE